MTNATTQGYDPHGYVFISYRQGDEGNRIATDLEHLLRASGIPVWRDTTSIGPGILARTCTDAIKDGSSGAILIITEDLADSTFVKDKEYPTLRKALEANPQFTLAIVTALKKTDGTPDFKGADVILEDCIPSNAKDSLASTREPLSDFLQYTSTRESLVKLAAFMQSIRVRALQSEAPASTLTLNVRTREVPAAEHQTPAMLDIRTIPADGNDLPPSGEAMRHLKDTIKSLPSACADINAHTVQLSGPLHLSVAFTIGATFPATSAISSLRVISGRENEPIWESSYPPSSAGEQIHITEILLEDNEDTFDHDDQRGSVAIYVDIVDRGYENTNPFTTYLANHREDFLKAYRLSLKEENSTVDPQNGGEIAITIGSIIGQLSACNNNARISLFLRCPFPLATLIGREMNTLTVDVYETDRSPKTPKYLPALRVQASRPAGVITEVLAQ